MYVNDCRYMTYFESPREAVCEKSNSDILMTLKALLRSDVAMTQYPKNLP